MKTKTSTITLLLFLSVTTYYNFLSAQNNTVGTSVYPEKINDNSAVYLTKENFNVNANGIGDDSPAIQAAIDLVLKTSQNGIVFIPEGTYRLGKTIYLWKGIRLIGYGKNRPVFRLGKSTPGFQEGERKYMLHFAHSPNTGNNVQPETWSTPDFIDGTWTTFHSGVDNINFEIEDGNPAAIAVRYHVAQVCALENVDFNIGNGLGGVEEIGNIVDNCTFRGGEFGIKTDPSPPDWQVMVLDCKFEGQRTASMITKNARMLAIRNHFKDAPIGILVPDRDKLFVKDSWFENISNTAISIHNFVPPELQVNLENITLSNVPYSVRFDGRTQGWRKGEVKMDYEAPAALYNIKEFSHGLHISVPHSAEGAVEFATKINESSLERLGEFPAKDMPALPAQNIWVNIADLGAKGDGQTDCTKIFEKAIAKYYAIYIPMGKYVISNTLTLKENTTLIGFHPAQTQLVVKDNTEGFENVHNGKPLIIAPKNGKNGISGIGLNLGFNPGIIGVKWMAGANSYINDGLFSSKHDRSHFGIGQLHTIWVTNGGGGIFKNFWINDRKPKLSFYISNTSTLGKIYEISVEHHKDLEVKLENVQNWSFYALQLEEDKGSEQTLGIYLDTCNNILFANTVSHRTTGVWKPFYTGIRTKNSKNLTFKGMEMRGGVFPFENALLDEINGTVVPQRIFTKLEIK
ncbi:glycosyl hydrolase family 28-related protein [Yeosuana marina]|uniref:glycosyl hydrolase family 28-related protein n=1 Tax=Yeosuana marina TaxID=1565536 RepID=UPI0030C8BCC0